MKDIPLTGNYIEITGNSLLALKKGSLESRSELEESKRLMRFILQSHLGTKPLASRNLFKAYTQVT
jgi:recombinational DNA repair protein (RecF pathway)